MLNTALQIFDLNVLKEMFIFLIQQGNPDSLLYLKKNFQELVVYLFRICHGLVNQMVWVYVHEEALSLCPLIVLLCSLGQFGTQQFSYPNLCVCIRISGCAPLLLTGKYPQNILHYPTLSYRDVCSYLARESPILKTLHARLAFKDTMLFTM